MMNSLSGKMSQRAVEEEWKIISDYSKIDEYLDEHEVTVCEHLENEEGDLIAYACLVQKDEVKCTKPLQLGCFILSQARVWMSKFLKRFGQSPSRLLGGYKLPSHTYYYVDTDSYIVDQSASNQAMAQNYNVDMFGTDIGQLEDDLKGGKIIRANFLAPKTYVLEFVKDGAVYVKVRCKGIPHTKEIIKVQPKKDGPRSIRSGRALYHLVDPDGVPQPAPYDPTQPYIRNHLDCEAYHWVQFYGYSVVAQFDQFRKLYFGRAPSRIADVTIKSANRHLSRDLWWSKGKRKVINMDTGFSVPIGHNLYDKNDIPQDVDLFAEEEQNFEDD